MLWAEIWPRTNILVWRMLAITMVSSITPFAEHELVRISCSTADLRRVKDPVRQVQRSKDTLYNS
jgi:hypothetical protein